MKAIVTGGAGFIGSNLTDALIKKGYEVIILDDLSSGKESNINPAAKFINVDLATVEVDEAFIEIFKGVDYVFHTAAKARVQPSIIDPIYYNQQNVNSTVNVLEAARKAGVKRVIYSASSSCYGNAVRMPLTEDMSINPLSPYGLQKYIGEEYCKLYSEVYGLDTVSLRYFNVYGPRMNFEGAYKLVIAIFIQQMREGKPLTITNDGAQRRDFTYVDDIVAANIQSAECKNLLKGEAFNIGTGDNFSVNELADMFGGEKQYGIEVLEPFETLADTSKARQAFGYIPKGSLPEWIDKCKVEYNL